MSDPGDHRHASRIRGRPARGARCEPVYGGHRLSLWGRLPARWAGNLALHLSAAGIRIEAGTALRRGREDWSATLLIRASSDAPLLRYDFETMARREPRSMPDLPRPDVRIATRPDDRRPSGLVARVEGRDAPGLLAVLLDRFRAQGFQPYRFVLSTVDEEVDDRFWLEPIDAAPSR